jgi:hypothetical protein
MQKFRLVTVSALVVLGLGTAACSSAPKGEAKAIATNSTASPPSTSAPTSTTAAPTSAPSTTTTTFVMPTTFVLPTTTVVPTTTVRVVHPRRPPKPVGPHRCPPGDVGKSATLLGANVVCTQTATGYFYEPAP